MIPIVRELVQELTDASIRYCHWKSTTSLSSALAGETDLDLLVDSRQMTRFASILTTLGFKPFISHPSRRLPGVEDWLGLDTATTRLVHLHVYRQLVLGEELVKNHRLPIEDVLLSRTTTRLGMPVPEPELELTVLAVRALLKYREDAFVRDLVPVGHRGGLPAGIRAEMGDLLTRTTVEAVRNEIDLSLSMLPSETIAAFLVEASRQSPRPTRLRALRHELEAALKPFERHGALELTVTRARAVIGRSRFARAGRKLVERVRARPMARRKRPVGQGLAVAVIGVDGAGKSTLVEALARTFGWRINVVDVYLGSSRPALPTRVAQGVARSMRRVDGVLSRAGRQGRLQRGVSFLRDVSLALRAVAEASERRRRIRLGTRLAAGGWLVLYDRYPMPALQVGDRRMDASRIPRTAVHAGWWVARLARIERSIYQAIPRPDFLIALVVDADTARRRKPDAPAALDDKVAAFRDLGEGDANMLVIDAAAGPEEVLRAAATAIWARL
jgi:thymidylate kinase